MEVLKGMAKKILTIIMALTMTVALFGCGSGENTETAQQQPAPVPQPKKPAEVVVPSDVEGKWKAIKIEVSDRRDGSKKEFTINIGEVFEVPNSDLTVEPMAFLPTFVMDGETITSASNEPNNPAAQIRILDSTGLETTGWLFQKFPETHKYPHEYIDITLVEGIPS